MRNTTHIAGQVEMPHASVQLGSKPVYLCSYLHKIITNFFVTLTQINGGSVFYPLPEKKMVNSPVEPEIKYETKTVYVPNDEFTQALVDTLKGIEFRADSPTAYYSQYDSSDYNRDQVQGVLNSTINGILVECSKILQESDSKILKIIRSGLDLKTEKF